MLMQSLFAGVFGGSMLAAILFSGASATEAPQPVEVQSEAGAEIDELSAANWTHAGCIQLGSNCYDVFRDAKGNLWVCEECFTTQNPNPGKCRKLTPQEIQNALWCA